MGLLEITKLATAENAVIHLHPADNVAIARVALSPGQELRVDGRTIRVEDVVPAGHKIAIAPIGAGESVFRYGQKIGHARARIEPGRHVHTHNMAFEELSFDYEFPSASCPARAAEDAPTPFWATRARMAAWDAQLYRRGGGQQLRGAHRRADRAQLRGGETLPPNVDGVVAFPHGEGCGHTFGPDIEQLRRTLGGVLAHPNVSAAVILGLGCEVNQIDHYLGPQGAAQPSAWPA